MFFLNKKMVFICLLLLLFCTILAFTIKANVNKKNVITVAFPKEDRIVILDAGHGSPDERSLK